MYKKSADMLSAPIYLCYVSLLLAKYNSSSGSQCNSNETASNRVACLGVVRLSSRTVCSSIRSL